MPTQITDIKMISSPFEFAPTKIVPEKPKVVLKSPDLFIKANSKSLASRNNNPGNLKGFYTDEFRVFKTLKEGYVALLHDLNLKITGKSNWTDSTTTIYDFINIYAPSFENDVDSYIRIFCSETGLQKNHLLKTQEAEIFARGIIKVEDVNLYHELYASSK